MIKVYVDWNVISGMKAGHFKELEQTFISNRQKFLLPYSTSHIGDIFASYSEDSEQRKIIDEDLAFITHLTGNLCLANDSKAVNLGYWDPRELIDDRIREAEMFTDFSIDKLFSSFQDDPLMASIGNMYKALIAAIPIEEGLKQAYEDPKSAEALNKLFPGLQDDLTMDGFFKSFGKMYMNLNETEGYKDLREIVQQVGVNSGHFNEHKNPFDVIGQAYEKKGMENLNPEQYFKNSNNAPAWFDEICNEYIKLDMHGYKADKVKVTEKEKNTFRNTTEDAFHTAFATRCDFYITNDDKNYRKSKAVYEKLGVFTRVLKPDEFLKYYNDYLNVHDFGEHWKTIRAAHDVNKLEPLNYQDGEMFGWVSYPEYFFFDFFNKLMIPIPSEDNALMILAREHPANSYVMGYEEYKKLVSYFVQELGPDLDGQTEFDPTEIQDGYWKGREWKTNIGLFRLLQNNGWCQLYIFKEEEPVVKQFSKPWFKAKWISLRSKISSLNLFKK